MLLGDHRSPSLLLLLGWLVLGLLLSLGGTQEGTLGSIDAYYDKKNIISH